MEVPNMIRKMWNDGIRTHTSRETQTKRGLMLPLGGFHQLHHLASELLQPRVSVIRVQERFRKLCQVIHQSGTTTESATATLIRLTVLRASR